MADWTPPLSRLTGQRSAHSVKERPGATVHCLKRNEPETSPLSPERWVGERMFG
jgi:hypothetical protein